MDNVFVYLVNLPDGVHEMVTPCLDGHTVYIDANLTADRQKELLDHAMTHIMENDFEKADVQQIEKEAHL